MSRKSRVRPICNLVLHNSSPRLYRLLQYNNESNLLFWFSFAVSCCPRRCRRLGLCIRFSSTLLPLVSVSSFAASCLSHLPCFIFCLASKTLLLHLFHLMCCLRLSLSSDRCALSNLHSLSTFVMHTATSPSTCLRLCLHPPFNFRNFWSAHTVSSS